jgi:nucleotide-binding universal stress UspA family protein
MRDLVVGIDASPASEQAVDRALLEAGVGGRRLVLVNALEESTDDPHAKTRAL